MSAALPVAVVVPVRNAEAFIERCLASVVAAGPAEIVVVDGCSTDRTRELVARFGLDCLSDGGRGVAAARMDGVRATSAPVVALIDADVVVPDGALAALYEEFVEGSYDALAAGQHSTGGPGYWGRAIARHHNTGRSRHWLGVVATLFRRDVLMAHPLDASYPSGEDIDLRHRLQAAGCRIGVSKRTVVEHRYLDGFGFVWSQFDADGAGLARVLLHGRGSPLLLLMPWADTARGLAVTVAHGEPWFVPYYLAHGAGNMVSMTRTLAGAAVARQRARGRRR